MKKLIIKCFAVTFFVFLSLLAVNRLTDLKMFNAFDPISTALAEFELTDYVFSRLRPTPEPDTSIVLVNLGPTRRDIAQQIRIISQYNPKVIGVDSFFNCEGGYYDTLNCPQLLDTLGNLLLSDAIHQAGNVVLVSRLLQTTAVAKTDDVETIDSIEYSDPIFKDNAKNAFANLSSGATYQEDVKICKSFIPQMNVNESQELAFAVQLAYEYDSLKTLKFLSRDKEEEIINFRGNAEISDVRIKSLRDKMENTTNYRLLCFAIDYPALMNGEFVPEMFKNKIVILGFLGDYFGDPSWNDKWFTPLNSKVAGRANPDMFGVVIHANIAAMILNEDYVNEIGEFTQFLIAFIICLANVALFNWVDRKFPIWFDGLSVLIQIIEILIVSAIIVWIFTIDNFKLDLTLTIATMALVGPCFDVYKSFENSLFLRFTNKHKEVLTTENAEIS